MSKTQAGRLLTLAWFLKTQVPRRHFGMQTIAEGGKDGEIPELDSHVCGTSACGLGWGTVVWPNVFSLKHWMRGLCFLENAKTNRRMKIDSPLVRNFFGIDSLDVEYLFGGRSIRTPKQEAKVIEDFVLSKGWEYA